MALEFWHHDHTMIRIQYRPISAPPHDGSDLILLQRFLKVKTERDFYTYFPWLFHDVPGMDLFASRNRKALKEQHENAPDRGSPRWRSMMDTFDFPTDWFVRVYGHGNWRAVHDNWSETATFRIKGAKMNAQIHQLLLHLQGFRKIKESEYGLGDIPATTRNPLPIDIAGVNAPYSKSFSHRELYLRYTLPLQVYTDFNTSIKMDKLKNTLPSRGGFGCGLERPMRMFLRLFQDFPGFKDFKFHSFKSELGYIKSLLMKPEWESFLFCHMRIRRQCLDIRYDEIPRIPRSSLLHFKHRLQNLKGASNALEQSPQITALRHLRQQGRFAEALRYVKQLDRTDPSVAFELQRIYEDQGYMNKEDEWYKPTFNFGKNALFKDARVTLQRFGCEIPKEYENDSVPMPSDSRIDLIGRHQGARRLLNLIHAYHHCFLKGEWKAALTEAGEIWEHYLKDWRLGVRSMGLDLSEDVKSRMEKEDPMILVSHPHSST
jgi:hypothetical protein